MTIKDLKKFKVDDEAAPVFNTMQEAWQWVEDNKLVGEKVIITPVYECEKLS